MTIREKNQHFMHRYATLLMPLLVAALSYAGVDGYGKVQEYRAQQAITVPAEVTVNVEAAPTISHTHGAVLSKDQVQAQIEKALDHHQNSKQYHEFDG